jgi:Sap-like sulfolipid-1-addressing protein
VIVEIFVLALASTIRPTSMAAVYALVSHDSRRALMVVYVVAGLLFTIAFGLAVVYAFHGIHLHSGSDQTKGIADLVGGALAVGFGVAILTGRVPARRGHDGPDTGSRVSRMLGDRLTMPTAAVAGPVTHIPGVFYLIALNVIVAHNPQVAGGTVAVLTYNAIWFALPLLALAACLTRPEAAMDAISAVERWARDHSRPILLAVCFGVGAALLVRGALSVF